MLFLPLTRLRPVLNTPLLRYFSEITIKNVPLLKSKLFTQIPSMSASTMIPTASFAEVKEAKNNPAVLVIDVREPSELEETGVIPSSINIPLAEVEKVLGSMTTEEFKKCYGREKPGYDSAIIVSCKAGKRGEKAQEIATKLGYSNVRNFAGGWLEWAEKNLN